MNIDKFTQKSIEAVNGCEKLAMEYGNQEIEQEHLLYSLLTLDDSLILKLVEKMEIQKDHFVNRAKQALEKRVKVQGGQPYVGQYLNKVLVSASDEAKQMGDEYVSVEHLFLAMIKNPNKEIAEIWKEYGITRERFLQALSTVTRESPVTTRKQPMIHWKNTGRIWWRKQGTRSWIPSSDVTARSVMWYVSCPVRQRITPC